MDYLCRRNISGSGCSVDLGMGWYEGEKTMTWEIGDKFRTLKELGRHLDIVLTRGERIYITSKKRWTREVQGVVFRLSSDIADFKHSKTFNLDFANERTTMIEHKILYPLHCVVEKLKNDPSTRQAYILEPDFFPYGPPCILIYNFLYRRKKLDLVVYLRSSDYKNVLPYDVYTAKHFLRRVALEVGMAAGEIVFVINSFHIYCD